MDFNFIHSLMAKKSQLIEIISNLKLCQMENTKKISLISSYQEEVSQFDVMIADISASKNAAIIKEHFQNLSIDGNFSLTKMWKLKQKLNLSHSDGPSAKIDKNGQLITTKNGL